MLYSTFSGSRVCYTRLSIVYRAEIIEIRGGGEILLHLKVVFSILDFQWKSSLLKVEFTKLDF